MIARLLEPHDTRRPSDGAGGGGPSVLVINAGSSSIKFALFGTDPQGRARLQGMIDGLGGATAFRAREDGSTARWQHLWSPGTGPLTHAAALDWILDWLDERSSAGRIVAVGHRVVHGGTVFSQPVVVDEAVMADLRQLVPLAPLHQPHNLAGIDAARQAFRNVPQVACFDTAFHRGQSFAAECFALPRRLYDEGVRRYGFHGLSYESIVDHLGRRLPRLLDGRLIVAHLGNGASMCAMRHGRSVATTMGFSALDGLPMGTRCGQVDPGVLLYLLQQRGLSVDALSHLLYHESGLKGLSGLSHDLRTLEAAGTPAAAEAIEHFVHRIRREIGALAAVLGGVDTLVFTGGIGENSVHVRHQVLDGLRWLGFELDESRNRDGATVLTDDDSPRLALRVPTDEEGMIARHTVRLVATSELLS